MDLYLAKLANFTTEFTVLNEIASVKKLKANTEKPTEIAHIKI